MKEGGQTLYRLGSLTHPDQEVDRKNVGPTTSMVSSRSKPGAATKAMIGEPSLRIHGLGKTSKTHS